MYPVLGFWKGLCLSQASLEIKQVIPWTERQPMAGNTHNHTLQAIDCGSEQEKSEKTHQAQGGGLGEHANH